MALFQATADNLVALPSVRFSDLGVLEGTGIQQLLRDQPEVLEPGLFVVAEEFSNWTGGARRIDLLALDKDRRLVVIELKRDERGGEMNLQAVRHAALASNMTFDQLVEAHAAYLATRGIAADARARIVEFLEVTDVMEPELLASRPRILLVAPDFSRELTTSVLWLNSTGLDIRCVRLSPYSMDGHLLVDVSQVVPLPEAEDYLVRVREKGGEEGRQREAKPHLIRGSKLFRATFADGPDGVRAQFEEVTRWAEEMEREGLVTLYTYQSNTGITALLPYLHLPHLPLAGTSGLCTIDYASTGPQIRLWRTVFERYASSELIQELEHLIAPDQLGQGTRTRKTNAAVLSLLRRGYEHPQGVGSV